MKEKVAKKKNKEDRKRKRLRQKLDKTQLKTMAGYIMQLKLAPYNWFKPFSKVFLLTVRRRYLFRGSFVLFMSCVCHAFASVNLCLIVTCWERTDLLGLVCDV